MAHKSLWFQGRTPYVVPKFDGKIPQTCPKSKRIAHEYTRGYFTLTNVLNPNIFYDDYGVETPLKKELAEAKVGDYLWLVLVPPKHHIMDVFTYNEVTTTDNSSLQSMGGITLSLVTGKFKAADENGDCEMIDEVNRGTLVMPDTADAKEQFLRAAIDITNDVETWTGVGVKIEALPADRTLADIVGKIVVGTHVIDYDAQTFM